MYLRYLEKSFEQMNSTRQEEEEAINIENEQSN